MSVMYFLVQVLHQDGPRFFRLGGEGRGCHPVDEIAFEHRGVSCNNPTTLFAGKLLRVGQRIDEFVDDCGRLVLEQFYRACESACVHGDLSKGTWCYRIRQTGSLCPSAVCARRMKMRHFTTIRRPN